MKKSGSYQRAGRGKKKKEHIVSYSIDTLPEPTKEEWERFNAIRDEDIEGSDIPELDGKFWKNAKFMPPLFSKKAVSIRLDSDVLEWFRGQGARYQSRINAVLRAYVDAHRTH
jgi:uncharacterized protein (DUF4415 family)